jgi:ribokinase
MKGRGHVVVLGSVNVDLVVTADRLPAPGETVTGGTFARHRGGKGANQAVAASRLGADVSLVGAVGDDEFGSAEREALRDEGVNVDRLATVPNVATGTALIVVDRSGENQIAVASGANTAFGSEIWADELAGEGLFLACFEVSDEAIVAGAEVAAAAGMAVLINPAPARDLSAALLVTRPVLVLNEGEAHALTGESGPAEAGRALANRSGAPVVVTLGPKGALVVDRDGVESIPAPVFEAVDTTGAGDTFVGALAAELSVGHPFIEAVRFAVQAASLSVRVPGAREGMPSRDEVEQSLNETWKARKR